MKALLLIVALATTGACATQTGPRLPTLPELATCVQQAALPVATAAAPFSWSSITTAIIAFVACLVTSQEAASAPPQPPK